MGWEASKAIIMEVKSRVQVNDTTKMEFFCYENGLIWMIWETSILGFGKNPNGFFGRITILGHLHQV
jgi:hypothetical protein